MQPADGAECEFLAIETILAAERDGVVPGIFIALSES
jgi:hypothetical protein